MKQNRTEASSIELTLPGFELPQHGSNVIAAAALEHLNYLNSEGLLSEQHNLQAQLVLSVAQSVGAQLAGGRLTIAGVTAIKQLTELLEELPKVENNGMTALVTALSEANNFRKTKTV